MRGFKDNKDIKKKDLLFSSAFTLVELIVVVVIIAILATIGVVGYSSWRQSTATAQLKSDLNGVTAAMENARTFGNTYPTTIPSTFVPSNGVTLSGGGVNSGKGYCVTATNGIQSYNISSQYSTPTVGPCSVLYLDAGIAASYPSTGNVWTDLSGNGNNGTLVGGTTYVSANGGSLSFDGSSGYVDAGTSSAANFSWTSSFSIDAWIKTSQASGNYKVIVRKSTGGQGYVLSVGGGTVTFYLVGAWAGNMIVVGSSNAVNDGQWHHLVATYDGSKSSNGIFVYVDGIDRSSRGQNTLTSDFSTTQPVRLAEGTGWAWYSGQIGEVSIYNKVLSPTDVKNNFNALRGRYGI